MLMSNILPFVMPLLITLTFLFTQLSHPLAMGLVLLIQTTLISLAIGFSTFSFWFSYILFLIFLGGMLILFIYVASLASNEYFLFSMVSLTMFLLILVTFTITFFSTDQMIFSTFTPFLSSFIFSSSTPLNINWIYNKPFMNLTVFIIIYLLLTLIVVVKIINLFKGPLRLNY
uniref:NADH dehydrogenase subunit 6 n=1 Tax=Amusiotheres obtusidentatus TaxID=2921221 RepID=UPI0020283EA6|nr:NADH dehydrogenase subunit 6 [Amusiotheres obtusidentatus]UPL64973.1 NADH dehydrogenase subunit 6 [Amusiotheres obtusidentatus]